MKTPLVRWQETLSPVTTRGPADPFAKDPKTPHPSDHRAVVAATALAVCVGLGLWRGGFFAPAQLALVAAAATAVSAARPARPRHDPIVAGLALSAAAYLAALALGGGSPAAALVPAGLAAAHLASRALPRRLDPVLLWTAMATALTAAAIGLGGMALRLTPYAERIDGVWRAGGTLEYPPALAVLCVCGLACTLALLARGGLRGDTAGAAIAIQAAAVLLTLDRAGLALAAVVVSVFFRTQPVVRRVLFWTLGSAAVLALAVAVALHPSPQRVIAHLDHDPLASRTQVYADAARAAIRHPLTGYGPGRFTRIYARMVDPPPVALAHDQVLEQAVEAGLTAAVGALVVLLAGLWRGVRALRSDDPTCLAFGLISLAVLASSVYDFTWSFAPLAALAVIALGRLADQPRTATASRAA